MAGWSGPVAAAFRCAARCGRALVQPVLPMMVRQSSRRMEQLWRRRCLFIDDLDGSAAEATVRFGLDGTEYEIDLNAGHAAQLREALAAYVRAGRRVSGGSAALPAAGAGDRRAG